MQKVMVYYFTKFDIVKGETIRSLRPATREAIANFIGVVQEDTAQEVDASRLDGNGQLIVGTE